MDTQEVRDLIEDGIAALNRAQVRSITTVGASVLVITFTDGAMARVAVTTHPAPDGVS